MNLSDMKASTKGTVKKLVGDKRFMSRITSIGLIEGASFQIVKNDKKMPVLVYVRDTLLALNRRDSESIEVVEVKA